MKSTQNNIQNIYPLTPMQEGMLFHALNDDSNAYFAQVAYRTAGQLDTSLFEQSIACLVERHDILRTAFIHDKSERPIQVVLRNRRAVTGVTCLQHLPADAAAEQVRQYRHNDVQRGFDLARDPLLRIHIFRLEAGLHEVVWSYHHILMDGWCISVLMDEFKHIYKSLSEGRPVNLAAPVPFSRYVQWLEKQDKAAALAWWQKYLKGYEQPAGIPPQLKPAPGQPYKAPEVQTLRFSRTDTAALEALARRQQTTLNVVFQALWGVLLARCNNTSDVVYGNVVSGRPAEIQGIENMLGLFINTVPLRIRLDAGTSFEQLLAQVHHNSVESLPWQFCPLAEIQAVSELKGELLHHIVAFENFPVNEEIEKAADGSPLQAEGVEIFEQTSYNFDIDVELGPEMAVNIYYNPAYYTAAGIALVLERLRQLAAWVLEQPLAPLHLAEIVTPAEKQEQLFAFNAAAVNLENTLPINLQFERSVAAAALQPAVLHNDVCWNYNMLNDAANQVAHLCSSAGIASNQFAGVHMERSPWMVAALLGILKAGAAYVPLDTQNPPARTLELLHDSHIRVLVTTAALLQNLELRAAAFPHLHTVICTDTLPAHQHEAIKAQGFQVLDQQALALAPVSNPVNTNQPDTWAYMLYTSGSTGKPKGAITRHNGAMNHILAEFKQLQLPDGFRFLQSASIASDISVWQILAPLVKQGAVVIVDKDDLLDYDRLANLMESSGVTIAEFVPSYLLGLAEYAATCNQQLRLPQLQWMMMVGEEVPPALVNQWLQRFPHCRVLNGYGPCEASDDIAQYIIERPLPAGAVKVPIGRPVENMNIFILDANGQLLPTGVAGELCVSGVGVGAGYFNEPAKTAEKFIPNPFTGTLGDTLYKTGDLARWLPDGNLEFLGRLDSQVKIRGFRVETGEIESLLRTLPQLKEVHVMPLTNSEGEKQLQAFVVLHSNIAPDEAEAAMRGICRQELPVYMHPAGYTYIDALPQNLSDKVDRKALEKIYRRAGSNPVRTLTPCTGEYEEKILAVWQKILGTAHIGATDNFFELGGHSLTATRLAAQINKHLGAAITVRHIFACPTIREQAAQISGGQVQHQPIPVVPQQAHYPLSHAQQRLWLVNQMEQEASYNYNMHDVYVLEGLLNPFAMAKAFEKLVQRHEILRTCFIVEEGEPRQQPLPFGEAFALQQCSLEQDGETALQLLLEQEACTIFRLQEAPLYKALLIKINEHKYVFSFNIHHILTDGWSSDVLVRDLMHFYALACGSLSAPLPPLALQYKDYAAWHNARLEDKDVEQHRRYWLERFDGELTMLDLPADYPRQPDQSPQGATFEHQIEASLVQGLKTLAASQGASMFMVLLAAIKTLLHRYTGQEDIIIGTPAAGREHSDLDDQVGFYVNTLPIRSQVSGTQSFTSLLSGVKTALVGAYEHQVYPFDRLVEDLHLHRELGRSPLFDVMVVMQNTGDGNDAMQQLPGLTVTPYNMPQTGSKFDLTIEIWEAGEQLHLDFEYNTGLFSPARIQRMAGHLNRLLQAVAADPGQLVGRLDYISPAEKQYLLTRLAGGREQRPLHETVPALFAAMAAQQPGATAVDDGHLRLTYGELQQKAAWLQHSLQQHGITHGQVVAIVLPRNAYFAVAMLGVLNAGAAYLPIEEGIPAERLLLLLTETNAALVITSDGELAQQLQPQFACLQLHRLWGQQPPEQLPAPLPAVNGQSLAYIMFTSGSTGQPKAVMIPHQGIVRLVKQPNYTTLGPDDRILQTGSLSFDAATFEIWGALLNGGQLHLLSLEHLLDAGTLQQAIAERGITRMWFTASWFNQLADLCPALFAPLRQVLVGGEQLSATHLQKVQAACPGLQITNGYGPTENTTFSICGHIPMPLQGPVTLGRPVSCSSVYIVDAAMQLVPQGIAGELLLGGQGLSRGYMNDEARTREKFIDNPFIPGQQLYRSGDLGRWTDDGTVEFLGRTDDQVKLRGYRIEPGEVANALRLHPQVDDACVTVMEPANAPKCLVAFYTTGAAPEQTDLLAWLKNRLPGYMVPALLVQLEKIPINKNGKLNRQALPPVEQLLAAGQKQRELPANETEARLLAVWTEVTGLTGMGVTDNFFETGGHSLAATRILARIQQEWGVKIGLASFFRHPAVRSFAALLQNARTPVQDSIPVLPEAPHYALSNAQQSIWIIDQLEQSQSAFNITGTVLLKGVLNTEALEQALCLCFERHEILRTVFGSTNGQPWQRVAGMEDLNFQLEIQSPGTGETVTAAVARLQEFEESHVFVLNRLPLARFQLLRADAQQHYLFINLHHIIADGWSLQLLQSEIMHHYNRLVNRIGDALPALPVQYKDFASWQNNRLRDGALQLHFDYWKKQLSGAIAPQLPADMPRPAIRSYSSRSLTFELDAGLVQQCHILQQQLQVSRFMIMQALVNLLLHAWTGAEDICTGTVTAGREHPALEQQLGFYVNVLVLRNQVQPGHSFEQLLQAVKQTTLEAFEHQACPFDRLVDYLKVKRNLSRNPLFDVMISFQDGLEADGDNMSGLEATQVASAGADSLNKYDITFSFESRPEGTVQVELIYNTSLFYENTMQRLCAEMQRLAASVLEHTGEPLARALYTPLAAGTKKALSLEDDFN